jgi:hypothetical protein
VLHRKGRDTLDLALMQRKEMLDEIGAHFSDPLRLNPLFQTNLAPLIQPVRLSASKVLSRKARVRLPCRRRESDA